MQTSSSFFPLELTDDVPSPAPCAPFRQPAVGSNMLEFIHKNGREIYKVIHKNGREIYKVIHKNGLKPMKGFINMRHIDMYSLIDI